MARTMKRALLLSARWNQLGYVELPKQRGWPRVIIWNKRAFTKATTGNEAEKYVEAATFAPKVVVTKRSFPKPKRKKPRELCNICHGKGEYLMPGDAHRSTGWVPCHCNNGFKD